MTIRRTFHIILILGVQVFLLPRTMCQGGLHWKKSDLSQEVIQGYYGASLILDCELNSSSIPVTFLVSHYDESYSKIHIDGKKYQKVGEQKLRINNLDEDDAKRFVCRADGISDKHILVFPRPTSYHSVTISGEIDQKVICSKKTADKRKIICEAVGSGGTVRLYKLVNGTATLIKRVQNEIASIKGHYVRKVIYTIEDATKKHEGRYVCYFDIESSRMASAEFHLKVDDNPPVIKSFISKVAKEDDKVTLKCIPNMTWPPEQISFFVNGKPVTGPNFESRYRSNCQKLTIDKVRFPDDHAVFTCKVRNKYGYDVKNATLTVLAKPVVEKSGGKLVERNVPVKCQIQRSYPPANITWQMQPFCLERIAKCSPNDSLWRNVAKDNFKIVSSTSYSELFVQPQDKGNYFFRCVAQNILGVDDSNFVKSLYFREVAKPLVIVNKSVKVNEREKIRVTCKAETKLFSKLYWLKDGKKLPQAVIVKPEVLSSSVTKSVLLIENATINDTGIYTCVGSGMRGDTVSTSATFTVRKIFPPIVHLMAKSPVKEGDVVVLHCNVSSNPTSQIVWYKDGAKIKVKDRNFLRGEEQCPFSKNGYYFQLKNGIKRFSRLIICDTKLDKNNGTFTCKARNQLGSDTSSANLNILKKPFLKLKATVSVQVGDTVDEICKAIGNPKPKVFWRQKASGIRMSSVSHSSSRLVITRVSEKDFTMYECIAVNAVGSTTATMEIQKASFPVLARASSHGVDQNGAETTLYVLVTVSFVATLIIIVAAFVLMRRRKIYGGFYLFSQPPDPDYLRDIDPSRALIEQANGLPYDPVWEFPRKRIKLLDRLGSGAFGDVFLAEAVGIICFDPREKTSMRHKPLVGRRRSRSGSTSSRTGSSYRRLVTKVAVKKLKENATPEEMRDLVSELKILIHIGEHSNIVNLLGACTRGGDKELMAILEYAPHGNLLSFLKNRRQMLKTTWRKEAIGMEDELTTCDLAVIAYQVAKGMAFLASRRCVHRDLAARNVLVGEGYVMKIADFGLARDIYKDDRYVKLSAGLLPVKWMAIEAIKERIFTHQSDVWSYGILLWEIMTMGGSPYPGLPVRNLLEALISGYRMDKPIYCPDEIYRLMFDCWIEDPDDRPMFSDVVDRCARIIESRLTPEESCNFLDPDHVCGDGYMRPIQSPRSPNASLISPPPPYSAYINQKENKFFGSDISLEEGNSCKKIDYPDVVSLTTKRLDSVSEMKAKRDAAEREKNDSLSSCLPENEFEEESDSAEATTPLPLLNGRICYDRDSERINFYECEKDVDETEASVLLDGHPYINQTDVNHENRYLNA